jgi:predicted flap endonuclease-1-like 5' DNA nuclease
LAGPDSNPVGTGPLGPTVLVNNTETTPINPPNAVPGATWEVSPDLPDGLVFDSATGIISGTPTQAMDNTTYTIWANTTDPVFSVMATFWLEVLEDYDGDGMPDELPDDYPDTGVEPYTLVEDEDDDNDGMSDTNESIIGTDPRNPDSDGDGFCDGNGTGDGSCYPGPDSSPLDPNLPVNTDGDAYPDIDPDGPGGLTADDDDDNDGFLDITEVDCLTNSTDATDMPNDLDDDGICDALDPDMDGDGIANIAELGEPLGTEAGNADTDGDGVCDGPEAPANGGCIAGPDAFPLDAAGAQDTDGDGMPDRLLGTSTSVPPLVEDLDDDDDTWSDVDETLCGSNPILDTSIPADTDGDGLCDALDDYLDLPFTLNYPTQYVDLFVNQTMEPFLPNVTGAGDVVMWSISGELPEGLTFGWSPARDVMLDGSIRGTPINGTDTLNFTIWASNSNFNQSFAISMTVFNDTDNDSLPDQLPPGYIGNLTADLDDDNDGISDSQETTCGSNPGDANSGENDWVAVCLDIKNNEKDDDGFSWMWCFPCLLILLLLLLVTLLLGRDQLLVLLADGPEPEHTTAEPNFVSGAGTEDDPFILAPLGPLQPGTVESSVEVITITNMGDIKVDMVDFNDEENDGRFKMFESVFSMEGTRVLAVGKDGEIVLNFKFDDRDFPSYEGGTYQARIKLGKASVYFLWDVTIEADEIKGESEKKKTMSRIKKRKKSFDFERIGKATKKDADDLQAIKGIGPYSEEKLNALGIFTYAQLALFDRTTEDDVNEAIEHYPGRIQRDGWVKQARAMIEAEAKADEEALKAAEEERLKAEAEAKAAEEAEAEEKAAKEAKAADAKAAKEAKAAEEKAAKEAKAAEEKAAKAEQKATAAAAAKKAKEESDAEKKADAKAAKEAKAAEEKAAKEAKAAEEKAAKEAKAAEEKAAKEAKAAEEKAAKEAKAAEEKAAKEAKAAEEKAAKEAKAAAAKEAKPASKEVKKKEELKRVQERSETIDFAILGTAKASEKDDLQVMKGIGPFIEEKLNALGIYTYLQVSKMTSKLETDVNEAIEFFPGRVKRDQWVNQAKILLGEDVKLDEKALKQAEDLERISKKAESIDFATLGVASASEKDSLQTIKGIGPFIEEKLNALGIFTFEQVGNMTSEIETQVNKAIEFFPGRVKRDEWAKQARNLHKAKN